MLPLTVPMLMPNGPAATISLELGAQAGTHSPVSACASGAEAISYGLEMIRTGRADVVVVGGTEAAIHPLPLAGFASMQALSTRNDEPGRASRPYDKGRDGFVLGEGAGVLVLESAEHAGRAVRASTPRSPVPGSPRTPITSRPPTHPVPAPPGRSPWPWPMPTPPPPTSCTSTRTPPPPRSVTSPSPGAIRSALGSAVDRRVRVGDQVDDRAPAGGGRRGGGHRHDPGAAPPRSRPRRSISTTPTTTSASMSCTPRPVRWAAGTLVGLNNSFGFGGHNVALAIRTA